MAFGDTGRWHVNVNGVPFRMDGESYEEAERRVLDTLGETPELFDLRATRLGLDQKDLDALELRFSTGEGALRGLARAEEAASDLTLRTFGIPQGIPLGLGAGKTLAGSGRTFVNRWRGARQAISQLFGDEEAAKAVAQEDADERGLYQQLDDTGVGLEDVGEIGTDIAAFLGATVLTGGGAIPMVMTGAALGASDVKDEVAVPGALQGETMIEEGRAMDAAIGGAFSAIGPAFTALRGVGSALGRHLGGSARMSPGLWLRARALFGNREAVTNIVDDALTYITPGTDKAREIIGRAALDKVQQIVARLPAEMSKGLKDPAAFGALRNAIQKATTTSSNGVNMFNPAIFEKEATAMIGQLGNIFEKAEHQFLAASIGRLSKAMQSLPQGLSPAAAERVAAALTLARPKADAIMQAIETATNPSVKTMLIDALVDHGQAGLAALRRNLPTAAVAGTSSNVATEGAEDVAEVIGNRNAESR